MTRAAATAALAVVLSLGPGAVSSRTDLAGRLIEIRPSTVDGCDEEFVRVASSLQPGDTLVLRGGTYSQRCRRRLTGLMGTPHQPIVITSAPGEKATLTRPGRPEQGYGENNLEIADSSHLVIRGLELRGGATGIRFRGTNRHIVLEDNEIHDVANNAIAMNAGDTDHFVIASNHIHHTGRLDRSVGTTEGEGLYVGCHDGDCVASHHVIEDNYIHDLRGTSAGGNDGIEIKLGSYGNAVRNNVIHNTDIGTRYPCIFVYGGGPARNVVEGNVMWRCGEAIQVVADATVRNNIIADSDVGITSAPHIRVKAVKDVTIVNNTLHGRGKCLYLRWEHARNMVLANNAVYCPTPLDAIGLGESRAVVRANVVQTPRPEGLIDGIRFLAGGSAETAFCDPAALDFWPWSGSLLIGRAAARFVPAADFNGSRRLAPYDVGAYETDGKLENPGWRVVPGFRGTTGTAVAHPPGPGKRSARPGQEAAARCL